MSSSEDRHTLAFMAESGRRVTEKSSLRISNVVATQRTVNYDDEDENEWNWAKRVTNWHTNTKCRKQSHHLTLFFNEWQSMSYWRVIVAISSHFSQDNTYIFCSSIMVGTFRSFYTHHTILFEFLLFSLRHYLVQMISLWEPLATKRLIKVFFFMLGHLVHNVGQNLTHKTTQRKNWNQI